MEEDLYDFINTAARIAGLESEEDITEEWQGMVKAVYLMSKFTPS